MPQPTRNGIAGAQLQEPQATALTKSDRGIEALQRTPVGNSSSLASSRTCRRPCARSRCGQSPDGRHFTVGPSCSRHSGGCRGSIPANPDFSCRRRQRAVFRGVGGKLMQDDAQRLRRFGSQKIAGPSAWTRAWSSTNGISCARIRSEQQRTAPVLAHQQIVRLRQRPDAAQEALLEVRVVSAIARRLRRHRLHHRE